MLTNKQFQEKLKQVNKGIKTDTIYNGNNTIMDCTCKYGHSFNTKAYNLIYNKTGCPICSGIKINIGFNDMWTTNPKLAELLLYKEDGYKYTQCSEKKFGGNVLVVVNIYTRKFLMLISVELFVINVLIILVFQIVLCIMYYFN